MSSDEEPVSDWLQALKKGDKSEAVRGLYDVYFDKLVRLARRKLQGRRPFGDDEKDVALSAFDSFCRRAGQPKGFRQLEHRTDVWRLLVLITVRKIYSRFRTKDLASPGQGEQDFDQFCGREPEPEMALAAAEEVRRLLDLLDDDKLVEIVLLKAEEVRNADIATQLGCDVRTVERRLRLIRKIWRKEMPP